MSLKEGLIKTIEEQQWIDGVAIPIQKGVRAVLDRAPAVEGFLHGKWLGHPLHAAMVSVPIGSFTVALGLDVAEAVTGSRRLRRGADLLTTVGLGTALTAATAGIADWSKTVGVTRRVGFVHGALNVTIAGVYGLSLLARSTNHRKTGVALSVAGFSMLMVSAWLGGELSFRFGVGVDVRREANPVAPAAEPEHIGEARIPEPEPVPESRL